MTIAEQIKFDSTEAPDTDAAIEAALAKYWRGVGVTEDEIRMYRAVLARAQTLEKSLPDVRERFSDTVQETWKRLAGVHEQYHKLLALVHNGVPGEEHGAPLVEYDPQPLPESYRHAAAEFEQEYEALIQARDNPETPFVVARIIDVDTSLYGATDDDDNLAYADEYEDDGFEAIIKNPIVRAEMQKNNRWMHGEADWAEESEKKAIELRYQDELAMSRIHRQVDREDDATVYLLKYNGLYHYIKDMFGYDITNLPEGSKLQLLEYLTTVKNKDIARIGEVAGQLPGETRPLFAEAFLATEFGDDFGDTILTLAEHLPGEQLHSLLEKVHVLREYGARFAGQFEGFDDTIVGEVQRAIAERVTETLYVAKALALAQGEPVTGKVLGNRITIKGMDEVEDALDLMGRGLQRIDESNRGGVAAGTYDEHNRSACHLGVESDVLVQVKPYGEQRGNYIKGLEHSEEAQINWSVDVLTGSGDYVPTRIADYRRRYALSIRLDLEGIIRDANGGKIGFDATRDQLAAALDIGSLRGASDNPNVRVARVVSLGNKLRKAELGRGRSLGYHTSLSPKYGRKEVFAALAEFIRGKHRDRLLGRAALVGLLDWSPALSSVSPAEKVAA